MVSFGDSTPFGKLSKCDSLSNINLHVIHPFSMKRDVRQRLTRFICAYIFVRMITHGIIRIVKMMMMPLTIAFFLLLKT